MNGIQIEYLLGLFFIISSSSYQGSNTSITTDLFKLVAGIILVLMAILGFSAIR